MHQVNLKETATQLADLTEAAASGEEVVIKRSDGASFQIVPLKTATPRPKFGSAKSWVSLSDDFDASTV